MRGKFGSSLSKSGAHDLHNRTFSSSFFLSSLATFPCYFLMILLILSPFVWCHPSVPLRTSLSVLGMRVALVWDGELPTFCMALCLLVVSLSLSLSSVTSSPTHILSPRKFLLHMYWHYHTTLHP